MRRHRLIAAVVCLMFAVSLFAQNGVNLDEGRKPFGSFHGGNIDTVSMTSGNVTIHIPIASYPQRGGKLDQDFYLRMNSKGWSATYSNPSNPSSTQKKWAPPSGRSVGPNIAVVGNHDLVLRRIRQDQYDCNGLVYSDRDGYRVETADGSTHWFARVSDGPPAIYQAVDASGYRLQVTEDPTDGLGDLAVLFDRNGLRYTFNGSWGLGNRITTQPAGAGFCSSYTYLYFDGTEPNKIEDANGNQLTGIGGILNASWTITDTLGRSFASTTASPGDTTDCVNPASVTSTQLINFPGPTGPAPLNGTSPVKLCFSSSPLAVLFRLSLRWSFRTIQSGPSLMTGTAT
jgi:hypothetical protein